MASSSQMRPSSISLHVPTSAFRFGPDIIDEPAPAVKDVRPAAATSAATQAPRRPHPSGLDTLPEASHINALVDATGPSPAGLSNGAAPSNNEDIDSILDAALLGLSAPSRSLAVSRAKGYSSITVEIANERWRERWSRLCLATEDSSGSQAVNASPRVAFVEGNPGGMGGSWELLAQLSGAGGLGIPFDGQAGKVMTRSSSRGILAVKQGEKSNLTKLADLTREAEEWRQTPIFHRGEVNISKYEETEGIIGVISPWLELDSADEGIRFDSEIALRQELSYASHLGITQVLLPPPSSDPACQPFLVDYARAIAGCLQSRGAEAPAAGHFMTLSIRLPISSPYNLAQSMMRNQAGLSASGSSSSVSPAQLRSDDDWSWQSWHVIENVCQYNTRLSIALDLSAPLPSSHALYRWISEPVSHIWLPSRAFLSNAKGYPVLSKACQSLLRSLISVKSPKLGFIIVGSQNAPHHHNRGGQAAYEQYIRHLEKSTPPMSANDYQARGYADYLQAPLQPLFDNLEAQTYATFEADAAKYIQYEEAIYQALSTRTYKSFVRIWVCGAGRGPLVDRCIEAARRARKTVKIVALEKNVNAIVGLKERAALEWGEDVVEVRMGDMRKIKPPAEKADIVVSELLGSFGDNELSPECLDGAMRFLKPHGISIPCAYTSYITPISAPKLHANISAGKSISSSGGFGNTVTHQLKAAETPYVVLLKAFANLAGKGGREDWDEVQDCWSFEHVEVGQGGIVLDDQAMPITNSHNIRTSMHTFHIPNQGVCHGLAGYFEAHLYGNVVLSIYPDATRSTKDMMSWFPIFFPFKEPIHLAPNSELDVNMWRLTSNDRVWYEWMAQAYVCTSRPGLNSRVGLGLNGSPAMTTTAAGKRHSSGSATGDAMMEAAFQNAPLTPRINEMSLGFPNGGLRNNGEATSPYLGVNVGKGGEEMVRRVSTGSGSGQGVTSSMGKVEVYADPNTSHDRFKVGMSPLMNIGGRSSWVGL
ncbi:hypothetical protein CBS101457_003097 [Exobasidium rhododendri]|nr:hypothetical protein CBS101457_003097 [Exobasidium rhododendri]